MKFKLFIWLLSIMIFLGCTAQKDMNQRRNLMIPQKDELPRNSKYKSAKRQTNKNVSKKVTKKSKKY
jgi:hypothetical protein